MKPHEEKQMPWWSDYSGMRLIGFLALLAAAVGAILGILEGVLVQRYPSLRGSFLFGFLGGATLVLPLIALFRMRKTGRDRWLLRKELRVRRSNERPPNI